MYLNYEGTYLFIFDLPTACGFIVVGRWVGEGSYIEQKIALSVFKKCRREPNGQPHIYINATITTEPAGEKNCTCILIKYQKGFRLSPKKLTSIKPLFY